MNKDKFKKKATDLLQKAVDHYNKNELLLAEHYARMAYNIAIDVSIPDIIPDILHNMAVFYYIRKSFESSIEYFKRSIKKSSTINEPNKLAIAINALGYVYRNWGDYQKALYSFNQAIEVSINNKNEGLAAFYFDLARTQKMSNKIDKAFQTYQKSIVAAQTKIIQTKPERHKFYEQLVYYCYNDLSEIHLAQDDLPIARKYHQQALSVLENSKSSINIFFEGHKRFEIPSKILVKEEKYNEAIAQLQKAKEAIIQEYIGFEVGKDLANIIHQIGDCYIQLKQYNKALKTYQEALIAVCNTFKNKEVNQLPEIDDIYNKRSAVASLSFKAATFLTIFETQNQTSALEQAYQSYQLIAKLIPITRRDYVEENSKFQLADETKGIYEKAIETCLKLYHLKNEDNFLHQAFYFAESSKAIVLQEKLQADFALQGMEQSVQQQDIDYRSKIAFYQSSINTNKATKGDEKQLKNWENELWDCKEAYEHFQQKIEEENPNYFNIKYAQSITDITTLQKGFSGDTALIEYFTGKDNWYVFVLTKGNFMVHQVDMHNWQPLEDIEQFKKLIHQFSISKQVMADYDRFRKLGYNLFQKLLERVFQSLDISINRLIIIPDGLLHHITFEALLTSEMGHHPSAYYHPKNLDYMCKSYALSYYYSASSLVNSNKPVSRTYDPNDQTITTIAPILNDLQYNQEEANQISSMFEGTALYKEAANIENFKQISTKSQIIHLSTHAKCNEVDAEMSHIQFHDNKKLDMVSIENMQITADLSVLSACETGYGFIQSGEGAMSLARSFYLAGCPSLVASLWRANDQSSAKLMVYFYEHLKNGATKDVALQQAKLQYCEEAGLRESHPFYWAGFVQFGNRKALF